MSDPETLGVYAKKAEEYAGLVKKSAKKDPLQAKFIQALPEGAHVLDLGCGPGKSAGIMAQAGLSVTAMDAVPEMIALVPEHALIAPVLGTFDDIAGTGLYDGIWANFSLLHAKRTDLPRHLKALHNALKPGGLFHIALKSGENSKRDRLGRYYTYYTQADLTDLLTAAGFVVDSCTTGRDVGLDGTPADWIALHAYG